jgi:predicted branched-subunit amino acid permease
MTKKQWFAKGMKVGIPISMGYFAVAIALGISAKKAGLSVFEASVTSLLINASAGEYAGFALIAAGATVMEIILMEAIANARYLLMSTALSQRLEPGTGFFKRLLLGFTVTDEIFGVSIGLEGYVSPYFTYGAFVISTLGWTSGTFFGALLGEILPMSVVTALGVGLFGMFVSIFIPEAKKNKIVAALVLISFAFSFAFAKLPIVSEIPEGIRVIIITVILSVGAALLFPIKDKEEQTNE